MTLDLDVDVMQRFSRSSLELKVNHLGLAATCIRDSCCFLPFPTGHPIVVPSSHEFCYCTPILAVLKDSFGFEQQWEPLVCVIEAALKNGSSFGERESNELNKAKSLASALRTMMAIETSYLPVLLFSAPVDLRQVLN